MESQKGERQKDTSTAGKTNRKKGIDRNGAGDQKRGSVTETHMQRHSERQTERQTRDKRLEAIRLLILIKHHPIFFF